MMWKFQHAVTQFSEVNMCTNHAFLVPEPLV